MHYLYQLNSFIDYIIIGFVKTEVTVIFTVQEGDPLRHAKVHTIKVTLEPTFIMW
jgi:outer membrane protein assembly factor BamA